MITDADLMVVIKQLGRDDLQKLFLELDIRFQDVGKAEYRANTTDVDLKAMHVLRHWRQEKGPDATRVTVLTALKECEQLDAMETVKMMWGITDDAL